MNTIKLEASNRRTLIQYLQQHVAERFTRIHRMLNRDQVELLGGFKVIPPYDFPGFIFRLWWEDAEDIHIVLLIDPLDRGYRIHIMQTEIPWEYWSGLEVNSPIFIGDDYEQNRQNYKDSLSKRRNDSREGY